MERQPATTPDGLVDELLWVLDLEGGANDRFTGHRQPGGIGRVYGGQAIAQALVAAERTVAPDREVHSLHAYFLRGGSEDHEIDFTVERDFDGGSFSNRRVIASQQGVPILNLTASFHRRESGFAHQAGMPDVPPPETLRNEADLRRERIDMVAPSMRKAMQRDRPLEVRPTNLDHWLGTATGDPFLATWFRTVAPLPDDLRVHRAVLAHASDYTLLGTSTVPHEASWLAGDIVGASLDHAVWFHDDFRADEWLLYVTDSPWAGRGRGFNRGRIYTRDGRLIAETAQEGLIRPARKPAG